MDGFHGDFIGISWDFMGFYGYYPMNFMEFDGTKGLMNGDLIGLGARPCVTSSCRSVWRRRRRPVGPGWMGKKGLELADVWCGANSCAIPNMTYPLVMCGICMEYIYIIYMEYMDIPSGYVKIAIMQMAHRTS